jgi:hypothetical protein|tara:strand:- start:365 stop:1171 length:807 start_codon:yes stop_codon:yes gene_type:complete
MFGTHFYNQGLRKLTIGFGQLFNNIMVQTKTGSGAVDKRMRIPLAYAPKKKFIARLDQQANLQQDREFAITLPRLGFELTGLEYDGSRKINKLQKMIKVKEGEEGKVQHYNYAPVPYNVTYSLYSFTATAENGLQIVEQILPYFQPDYTVTVNMIPDLDIKRDVPIILKNINYEDTYDGSFTKRRAVIYTLNFVAKTYLYGPMSNAKAIKEVQSDIGADTDAPLARDERIIIVPNPTTADADDDFGFTTSITFYADSKRYNPGTDSDT